MMSMIRTVDRYLYGVFQKIPHLSASLRLAFAKDIWISAILLLVLYAVQLFGFAMNLATSLLSEGTLTYSVLRDSSLNIDATAGGFGLLFVSIYILFLVGIVVQLSRAIKPLRSKFREGWLLFLSVILLILTGSTVSAVAGLLAAHQAAVSIVVGLLFLYIIYEVRQYFEI